MEDDDEINEMLENNHINDYNPSCGGCVHWKKMNDNNIGECNSNKFLLKPVMTKGKNFFCSDYSYKKRK